MSLSLADVVRADLTGGGGFALGLPGDPAGVVEDPDGVGRRGVGVVVVAVAFRGAGEGTEVDKPGFVGAVLGACEAGPCFGEGLLEAVGVVQFGSGDDGEQGGFIKGVEVAEDGCVGSVAGGSDVGEEAAGLRLALEFAVVAGPGCPV